MERRELLKGFLMLAGAGVVGASLLPSQAEAATPPLPEPELKPEETAAEPEETRALDEAEKDADGQYYYYRRRRRIRRRVYRRRVVYYRRPRRVYYYRPRRVYYRRRYYW